MGFKGFPGWISSTLKNHKIDGINLHGEADYKTAE